MSRPLYAPLDREVDTAASQSLMTDDNDSQDSSTLADHQLRRRPLSAETAQPAARKMRFIPPSRRFWADFTMGFADGLTVPFALTAGLSSLGRTDTVLSAGLAEISAGCISMGISGYLSARQTAIPSTAERVQPSADDDNDDEEASYTSSPPASPVTSCSSDAEKRAAQAQDEPDRATAADRYLQPLDLPSALRQLVLDHVAERPHVAEALAAALQPGAEKREEDAYSYTYDDENEDEEEPVWPVATGLSVAVGYLVGGMLPLWPYFFVEKVGDGLRWSFAACILCLFLFGFLREFCLASDGAEAPPTQSARQLSWRKPSMPWRRIGKSTMEGLQMVTLGGIAAMAAVLCVRWFEDSKTDAASAVQT